jgi:DNA primase catalytic core
MLQNIVSSCRYLLQHYPEAKTCQDYLDSRLTPESQEKFQFGYFPSISHLAALLPLVSEDILIEDKLLKRENIEDAWCPRTIKTLHFEDHPLIMPYKDPYGNVVGIVGRSLLSDQERKQKKIPKYKNTSHITSKIKFQKGKFLFGLYENKEYILEKNSVYIVEGQFDVIKAVERGFRNIVALGNSNMTPYQFSIISRYTTNIRLLLDSDEAGEKGRKLIVSKFGHLANIHNFYLPEGYKDIDEYLTENSYESLTFTVKH